MLHLYTIPGNHDWYDSLGGFVKQFCSGQWIGAWQTQQDRSYFAVRLPHGWWLWGIDVAFEGPMDDPQLRYFQAAAKLVDEEDGRVILCTAYPRWFESGGGHDGAYSVIRGFVHKTFGDDSPRVRLMLSGDKHVYARYSPTAPDAPGGEESVKIASGGGGAYLSGTQDLEQRISVRERRSSTTATEYALASVWPEPSVARAGSRGARSLRVWRHWSFSVVIALLYLLLATIMRLERGARARHRERDPPDRTPSVVGRAAPDGGGRDQVDRVLDLRRRALDGALGNGAGLAARGQAGPAARALAVGAGPRSRAPRRGVRGHHDRDVVRVLAQRRQGLGVGRLLRHRPRPRLRRRDERLRRYLVLAQLRRRSVWALVALLAEQDWKNFLRIRVEEHQITVYALGLEHVPRPRTATWDADGRLTVSAGNSVWKLIDRVTVPRT